MFLAGPMTESLWTVLPEPMRGGYADTAADLESPIADLLRPGDVIMIKGSNASRLGPLAEALRARFAATPAGAGDRTGTGNRLMFHYLSQFGDQISVLNVFRYITFRTGGATVTALLFSFVFGPTIIAALQVSGKARDSRFATTAPRTTWYPRLVRRPWVA